MYELRRTYVTLPGKERLVASMLQRMGQILVDAGVRDPFHVSFNGGTCPGDKQLVHMTWTAEKIESTYRGGRENPAEYTKMMSARNELTTDTWIEFSELMNDAKLMDA
ncbi:MAG: hypothetical protein OTJ98_02830 [Dehalococcoidia bacterium]|nr:hypothetical protein [Dehalococcoidia bacterium]